MITTKDFRIFSAGTLKILACVFMLLDHIGMMLCPQALWMRVVGRLAYPIFAYFIAQGCVYTSNKLRRFLSVFVLGIVCEAVYMLSGSQYYGNILLTFSFSILLIYLLFAVKSAYTHSKTKFALMTLLFLLSLAATFLYCEFIGLDYGFFGVVSPVLCVVVDKDIRIGKFTLSARLCSMMLFSVGLILVSFYQYALTCQWFSLFALVLLLLYNGERGRYNLKYAFYLFYPLHLVVLQGIYYLIQVGN